MGSKKKGLEKLKNAFYKNIIYNIKYNNIDSVLLYIENGADISCKDYLGYNMLDYSCKYDKPSIVNVFLNKGLDPINNLEYCKKYCREELIKYYRNNFDEFLKDDFIYYVLMYI